MSTALKDVDGKIKEKSDRLAKFFDKKTADGRLDIDAAGRDEMKSLNDELSALGRDRDQLKADDEAEKAHRAYLKSLAQPADDLPWRGAGGDGASEGRRPTPTIGQQFIDSEAYKAFKPGNGRTVVVEDLDYDPSGAMKTVMTTAAGFAPFSPRGPIVVPYALRRPIIADLIPQDPTSYAQVLYMEQTTNTMNAAAVAENATKPESAFVWTQRTNTVEVIATTLPVTNQQMADVPGIRGVIDSLMTLDLQLAEESYLLTGTGTTPQLQGILTKSGIQTQAKGADPTPTAAYKAMTLIRFTGFADPSGFVFNPTDWQDVKLLQTADGLYIWGSPSDEGPDRLWSLPVIITPAMTLNTALVGDFRRYAHISRRQGVTIDAGYVNDDFAKNRMTLRAEERLSLEILRPAAFATLTGV